MTRVRINATHDRPRNFQEVGKTVGWNRGWYRDAKNNSVWTKKFFGAKVAANFEELGSKMYRANPQAARDSGDGDGYSIFWEFVNGAAGL